MGDGAEVLKLGGEVNEVSIVVNEETGGIAVRVGLAIASVLKSVAPKDEIFNVTINVPKPTSTIRNVEEVGASEIAKVEP